MPDPNADPNEPGANAREETLKHFGSLNPQPTVGPRPRSPMGVRTSRLTLDNLHLSDNTAYESPYKTRG